MRFGCDGCGGEFADWFRAWIGRRIDGAGAASVGRSGDERRSGSCGGARAGCCDGGEYSEDRGGKQLGCHCCTWSWVGDGWRRWAAVPQGMGGYFGEQRQNGDGVIVDNATDLDPSAKAGAIITPRGGGSGFNLTGPFTKFDQSDTNYVKGATADTASMVSNTAGWISSTAATGAAVPSPFAPAFGTIAYGATVVGIGADAVS